jgi:predicted nucleic acid-binding protein
VLYLDSSAIVKLVVREPETPALMPVVAADPDVVTSAIAYPEVMRAIRRIGGPVPRAEQVLSSIALIPVDRAILMEASAVAPTSLRTLDAIHIASALSLQPDLDGFVAYDARLSEAATAAGLRRLAPDDG